MKFYSTIFNLLLLLSFLGASAQTQENSPYSADGIGLKQYSTNVELMGAGKISTSFQSNFAINPNNPASLKALTLTSFQAHVSANRELQSLSDTSQLLYGGGFHGASLAFPINKYVSTVIGFSPYSAIGYTLNQNAVYGGRPVNINNTGGGNINKAFGGIAINPFQFIRDSLFTGFSVGYSASFLFGQSNRRSFTRFLNNDTSGIYSNLLISNSNYRGVEHNIGLQYGFTVTKKLKFLVAGNIITQTQINVDKFDIRATDRDSSVSNGILFVIADTFKTKQTIPTQYQVGFSICYNDKLTLFADYKTTDYTQVNFSERNFTGLVNNEYSVGLQLQPSLLFEKSFFSRNIYRISYHNASGMMAVKNTPIAEQSVFASIGLAPKKYRPPMLNIGFEWRRLGTTKSELLQQDFYAVHLGITINDKWFVRRRID